MQKQNSIADSLLSDPTTHPGQTHKEWGVPLSGSDWSTPKRILDKGTFGIVYKAKRIGSDEHVAIKEICLRSDSGVEKDSIIKEADSLNMFNNTPNIVRVLDVVKNNDTSKMYIVMEFCNRQTLFEDIKLRRTTQSHYSYTELIEICLQVLTGLAAIHERGSGYCHLDLKPQNIGIDERDFKLTYKLLDFGFLYNTGQFDHLNIGTLGYKAPEIVSKEKNLTRGTKADIFSFGCVLYQAAFLENLYMSITSGCKRSILNSGDLGPTRRNSECEFEGDMRAKEEYFYKVLKEGIQFPNEENEVINKLIQDCLNPDPDQRPTARESLKSLGFCLEQAIQSPLRNGLEHSNSCLEDLDFLDNIEGFDMVGQIKRRLKQIISREKKEMDFNGKSYSYIDNKKKKLVTKGFSYYGQVNESGERHGKGACWNHSESEFYFGFYEKNKKNGLGCCIFSRESNFRIFRDYSPEYYIGKHDNDLFTDFSGLCLAGGIYFKGDFKEGKICGRGTLSYYKNGWHYTHKSLYEENQWEEIGTLELRTAKNKTYKYKGTFSGDVLVEKMIEGEMADNENRRFCGVWSSLFEGTGTIKYLDKNHQKQIAEYVGGWKDLKRSGKNGMFRMSDSSLTYKGDFEADRYEGKGTLYDAKAMKEYSGYFKASRLEGPGEILKYASKEKDKFEYYLSGNFREGLLHDENGILEDGVQETVYKGNFVDGRKDGIGVLEFKKGDIQLKEFSGEFRGEMPFFGVMKYRDGGLYDGELLNYRRNGKGKMVYSRLNKDFRKYDGFWKDDMFNGKGTLFKTNEEVYSGDFENGLMHGSGELGLKDGDKIKGRFVSGVLISGKHTFNDGSYYIGQFNKDKNMHGRGSYQYLNGDQYTGDFENGVIKGKGLMNYGSEGRKDMLYQGVFCEGKRHGQGELRTKDYEYFGNFESDMMHGQGVIIYKDPNCPILSYEGSFVRNEIKGHGRLVKRSMVGAGAGDMIEGKFYSPVPNPGRSRSVRWEGEPFIEEINCEGEAEIFYESRNYYKGEIKRGEANGRGKLVEMEVLEGATKHFYTYEGKFSGGVPDGIGEIKFEGGDWFGGVMQRGDMKKGKFKYKNGDVYEGEFLNFSLHGEGKIDYLRHSKYVLYKGGFKENNFHGFGKLVKKNGAIFEGKFENGSQSGYGTLTTKERILKGEFKSFYLEGQGEMIDLVTKDYYIGPFREGVPFTLGNLEVGEYYFGDANLSTMKPKKSKDRKLYVGSFFKGEMNGHGIINFPNGDKYDGQVEKGVPHGQGLMMWKNGDTLEGVWTKGIIRSGKDSKWTFGENSPFKEYKGEYYQNVIEGIGDLIFKDGRRYQGDFYRGMIHGRGKILVPIMTNSNQTQSFLKIFEGLFENGKINGQGTTYSLDGENPVVGIFKDEPLIKK